MGDLGFVDTMIKDGLWTPSTAITWARRPRTSPPAEITARTRTASPSLAEQGRAAQKSGRSPVRSRGYDQGRKGDTVIDQDEYIRHGSPTNRSPPQARLHQEGSVTAPNAPPQRRAAAWCYTADDAARRGLKPLVRIVSWAHAGVDPQSWARPDPGTRKALEKAAGRCPTSTSSNPTRPSPPVDLGRPRTGPRHGQGERQRRGDRHRPSDRRLGRPDPDHPRPRDAAFRRSQGPRHPLRGRRHGRGHVR